MNHKHHKIPKHQGGTNDPSNIIELSIAEHAEEHRLLYEKHGRWQDRLAWLGLLKLKDKQELLKEMLSEAGRIGAYAVNLKRWGYTGQPKLKRIVSRKKGVGKGTQNRLWFHDPENHQKLCLLPDEKPPQGWKHGQGKKNKIACFWYTDDHIEGQFAIDKQPDGWRRGRCFKSRKRS